MNKILENLSTHGLGEPNVIHNNIDCKEGTIDDFKIIDVTMIHSASPLSEYKSNIIKAAIYLENGDKAVICCCHGRSRSNAIAVGVLVYHFKMNFDEHGI